MSGESTPRADRTAPTRGPDLVFLASATAWLLVGTLLALVAAVKLHAPGFLATSPWLTFGRVQPAHVNVMIYGWGSMAGVAVLLWLSARLSGAPPRFPALLTASALLWNIGVAAGTIGVLVGGRTGVPWLEFPARASLLIAVASILAGLSIVASLIDRKTLDVPGWYALAAACAFPWLHATAALLTVWRPIGGVSQAVAAAWFADGLMNLWFGAIALAVLYALLPAIAGRPVASRSLAALGFWLLMLLGVWTGGRRLVGGPAPAWVVTLGIVAGVLLLVHVAAVALNLLPLVLGRRREPTREPAFGFLGLAAVVLIVAGALEGVGSLRSVARITHFTHAEAALTNLKLFGSFSMAVFGAVYLVLPRLSGRDWSSRRWIRLQFWCVAAGVLSSWAILTTGGVLQGLAMDNPQTPFIDVARRTVPFLMGRTAAEGLAALGYLIFGVMVVAGLRRGGPIEDEFDRAALIEPREETTLTAQREEGR